MNKAGVDHLQNQTLCWDCRKACGGCPWADEFRPVRGWDAEETILRLGNGTETQSYRVSKCPLFVRDCQYIHGRGHIRYGIDGSVQRLCRPDG